jgi:PTS system mannose-specific IIC component
MISLSSFALLGVLGGAVELDRAGLVQTMVSRPLVAAAVSGWVLGEPTLGLACGALLELLWLMDLPVGAALPPDEGLAGLLASAFAVSAPEGWPLEARAGLGVLVAVPFGYVGRLLEGAVRRWNSTLLRAARERVSSGRPLGASHWAGGLAFFVAGSLAAAAGGWLGCSAVRAASGSLPAPVVEALGWTAVFLPVVGAASVLSALRSARQRWLFCAGVIGSALLARVGGGALAWRGRWRV